MLRYTYKYNIYVISNWTVIILVILKSYDSEWIFALILWLTLPGEGGLVTKTKMY